MELMDMSRVIAYETKTTFKYFFTFFLLVVVGSAVAQNDVGDLAGNVKSSFEDIGLLMIVASYIGGFALTIAAIFKFKQHKDNPTQIPIGTPIALLVIGIILVFLPSLFGSAGQTIFGGEQEVGGFEGNVKAIEGGSSGGGGSL
jgi:intracellular multiplication protein IcmD